MRGGLLSSWRYLDRSRSTCGTSCLSDYGSLRLRREPFTGSALPQDGGDFSQFRVWARVSTGIDHKFEDLRTGLGPPADQLSGVSESRQRTPPLLPTSLPAGNLRRQALEAVRQNSLRVCDASFKHVAVKVMRMQLHSEVQLPAPRTCRHRRGHKGQYRVWDSSE